VDESAFAELNTAVSGKNVAVNNGKPLRRVGGVESCVQGGEWKTTDAI